jgi:hypothetical protein
MKNCCIGPDLGPTVMDQVLHAKRSAEAAPAELVWPLLLRLRIFVRHG